MAVAEALPLADHSMAGITVGQAMHWFDKARAAAEFRRVLQPGGRVGLIWNARDRSMGYMDELWTVMDSVEKRAPWRNHDAPVTDDVPGFRPAVHRQFHRGQTLDRAAVHDRFLSVSHVAVLPEDEKAQVIRRVDGVLDAHFGATADEFELVYNLDVYWLEPLP